MQKQLDDLFSTSKPISIRIQEVDLASTLILLDETRASVFDYHILLVENHRIAYAAPTIEPDMLGFVKPLTPMVSMMHYQR